MGIVTEKSEESLKMLIVKLSEEKNMYLPNYINEGELSLKSFFDSMEQMGIVNPDVHLEIKKVLE